MMVLLVLPGRSPVREYSDKCSTLIELVPESPAISNEILISIT